MISKIEEKAQAIKLRQKGLSYQEILKEVFVSKSTLSLWLKEIKLSKSQTERLTKKILTAAQKGGKVKRDQRIKRSEEIREGARKEISAISQKELWFMGIMLYWAEGSKEKEKRPGSGVKFTNGDSKMIQLFLKWLFECCEVKRENIVFEIYIHDNHKDILKRVTRFWSLVTDFPEKYFTRIYFKKDKPKTKRTNTGKTYFGTLRINVKASSILHRKIAGWIEGLICSTNH